MSVFQYGKKFMYKNALFFVEAGHNRN